MEPKMTRHERHQRCRRDQRDTRDKRNQRDSRERMQIKPNRQMRLDRTNFITEGAEERERLGVKRLKGLFEHP